MDVWAIIAIFVLVVLGIIVVGLAEYLINKALSCKD